MNDRNSSQQHRGSGGQGSSSENATQLPPIELHAVPIQFIENAETWADLWKRASVTPSQVRRFYGEVRRLQQLIAQKGDDGWKSYELEFRMLKPKAAYARKAAGKAPQELTEYVKSGVEKVRGLEDFKKFVQHFESVVGFAYGMGLKDK